MQKFLIGLLTGIILAILAGVIVFFSLLRFGERKPQISDRSTLLLRLDGEMPEKAPVEIPIPFIGGPAPTTIHDTWSLLRKAAADSRIKAAVLVTGDLRVGWGKIHEIRKNLVDFKKSGKPLYAFVRSPGAAEYYVATAADRIYMAPEDILDVKGLRAELMFFKGTLDKLGVQMQVQAVGKYKDAGDMFTENTMSPETREVINSLLDGMYGELVNTIAASRKKSADDVRTAIDQGPFIGEQAVKLGFLDALRFEDQVYGELKDKLGLGEIKKISHRDYQKAATNVLTEGKKRIAFVVGDGAIVRGAGEDALGSDDVFSSGAFIRLLQRVANDKDIHGVIMRVDSPGGDAIASDEILREVKLLREKKPLVISMSDTAASGGYYVAMTGDPIVAYPNTVTGSIGVIYGKPNLRGLYDKLGIQKDILTRGRNADLDTDYGPLTESGKQKLNEVLQNIYHGFVSKAAASRKLSYEELEKRAQGRVWLGTQAKANGLIDEIGGIDKAIEIVKQKAKIPAHENVRLVPYPPKRSIIDQWLRSTTEPAAVAELKRRLNGLDYRVFLGEGYLKMMPYSIRVY